MMHRTRRRGFLGFATLALVGLTATPNLPADADETCPANQDVLTTRELPEYTDVEECEVVGELITNGEAILEVPEAGGVAGTASVGLTRDEATEFVVEVDDAGLVTYQEDGASSEADESAPSDSAESGEAPAEELDGTSLERAASAQCTQDGYALSGSKWYGYYRWYLGDGVRPDGMSTATVKDMIADGIDNITHNNNGCGYVDNITATSLYSGTTTYETDLANVDGMYRCTDADGVSTVDFGNIDDLKGSDPLAVACWWDQDAPGPSARTESDIRVNTTNHNWTNAPNNDSCVDEFDLRAVITHEAGHAFGLRHATSDSALTMFPETNSCDAHWRTLGRGDYRGLRVYYY